MKPYSLKFMYSYIKDEITFTPAFQTVPFKALIRRLQTKPAQEFMRLEIAAGQGCQGYTYKFKFDSQLADNDFVQTNEDKRVVFAVGEEEMKLVKGTILDHTSQMMREAFFVKENPNAEISCSWFLELISLSSHMQIAQQSRIT